jgi:hypothetical protein
VWRVDNNCMFWCDAMSVAIAVVVCLRSGKATTWTFLDSKLEMADGRGIQALCVFCS